jgi:hypothetical protein
MTKSLQNLPLLYLEKGTTDSSEIESFLSARGIPFRLREINDPEERDFPGDKLPLFDWNGDVIEDFSVEELVTFLHRHDVELEES